MENPRAQPARQRAKRGSSCIACRQMKLRCDSADRFPQACSRCAKVGRACSLDPTFKRSTKSERLEQLEKDSGRGLSSSGPASSTRSSSPNESYIPGGNASHLIDVLETPELQTRALEHIEISPEEFFDLADLYYLHYQPQLPIFPSKAQLVTSCTRSQVLFWAVVCVTCRASSAHRHIHPQLAWPMRRLAMSSCAQEVPSLEQVQALLLLSMWPLPFGSVLDDPSSTLCGIATCRAKQLGMHRPLHVENFMRGIVVDEDFRSRIRNTWLACFVVNQSVSQRSGVPSGLRPDHTICQAIGDEDDESVPPRLRMLVELMHKDYIISSVLGHDESTADGLHPDPLPLIKAYDQELEIMQRRLERSWPPSIEMTFLGMRARLYSFALSATLPSPRRPSTGQQHRYQLSPDSISEAANYMSKLYSTVMNLLRIATQGCPSPKAEPRADDPFHMGWSGMEWLEVIQGTFMLLHVLRRRQHNFNTAEAQNTIRRAWTLIRSASIAPTDHYDKMCDVVAYVTSVNWPAEAMIAQPPEVPQLAVRSRMGANLVFDLVHWAKNRSELEPTAWLDQIPDPGLARLQISCPPPPAGMTAPSAAAALDAVTMAEMMPGMAMTENLETLFWTDWDRTVPHQGGPYEQQ